MNYVDRLKERQDVINIWQRRVDKPAVGDIVYRGPVTGLSHYSYEDFYNSDWLETGEDLLVVPHPSNKYDSNAVGFNLPGCMRDTMIGWIPKGLNGPAATALKRGMKLEAIINENRTSRFESGDYQDVLFVTVTIKEIGTATEFKPSTPTDLAVDYIAANPNTTLKTSEGTYAMIKNIATENVAHAKTAAFLEAGRVANNQISKVAGKKLPIMVRAYAETPMGRLIIANIANMAQQHFRPTDAKLATLTDAMITSAYQEVLQHFDVEGFIEELLSDKKIKSAMSKMVEAETEEA